MVEVSGKRSVVTFQKCHSLQHIGCRDGALGKGGVQNLDVAVAEPEKVHLGKMVALLSRAPVSVITPDNSF